MPAILSAHSPPRNPEISPFRFPPFSLAGADKPLLIRFAVFLSRTPLPLLLPSFLVVPSSCRPLPFSSLVTRLSSLLFAPLWAQKGGPFRDRLLHFALSRNYLRSFRRSATASAPRPNRLIVAGSGTAVDSLMSPLSVSGLYRRVLAVEPAAPVAPLTMPAPL